MSDLRQPIVTGLTVATLLAAGARAAWAQLEIAPPPVVVDAATPGGEDVAQGVFVRDSTAAVDRFALAARLESLGEWTKAADVYQQIVVDDGDRLIADRSGSDGKIYQYAGVARATQRKLAAWPPAGREVYQQKFGGAAQALLEQAMTSQPPDAELLQQAVRLYFVTDAAKTAALKLIDLHLVAGRFSAAKRLADELLDHHPALGDDRPALLLRGVVAAHFLGDDAAADHYVAAIKKDFPDAVGLVAGEQQKYAVAADAVLAAAAPPAGTLAAGQWPTFAGGPSRDRAAPPLTSAIAPYLRGIEMPDDRSTRNPVARRSQEMLYERGRRLGQMTGLFPVAYDGALYWSDNVHVFAVGLESGLPLPGWLATHGEADLAAYALPGGGYATPPGVANTPSVVDRYVLALLGARDARLYTNGGNPAVGDPQLVCLDRLTGRPLWTRKPADLDAAALSDPALRDGLAQTQFVGTPLVVGDNVWLLAQSDPQRNGDGFEQNFLVSLDLATGRARTLTYLSSATRGFDPRYGNAPTLGDPNSPLAYADGLVYAPTDGGVLAAVRESDGAAEWLNLYPREVVDPRQARMQRVRLRSGGTPAQPFMLSPPIVSNGHVFFRPPDARQLFVYDASDGREVARIDLGVLSKAQADRSLLAVRGDEVILYGARAVGAIDWKAARDGASPERAVRWIRDVPPPAGRDDSILGRPGMTADRLLVPAADKLYLIDLDAQGKVAADYPADGGGWADDEEPGNVIVVDDQVVIAGPTKLNVYADSQAVRGRLARQLADDPTDPTPMLRLAQVAFVGGDFTETTQRLRQAEQAAGQLRPPERARAAQREAFASSLGFAQSLRNRLDRPRAAGNPTPATVDKFFDLSEKFARTAAQNVELRFKRADYAAGRGESQRRATLLQEILADAAWRQVAVLPPADARDDGDAAPRRAGEVARQLLAELIARQGAAVYAPIESRAAEDLAAAKSDGDVAALRRVADVYPNSAAAGVALAEAARRLRDEGRVAEAVAVLRRLAADRAGDADASVADWTRIAELDATRPERFAVAAGRVAKAARLLPDAPAPAIAYGQGLTTAGQTLRQAADALAAAVLERQVAALPSFDLPSDAARAPFAESPVGVDGVAALLVPGDPKFDRPGRVVARGSDGAVSVYAFGSSKPLWTAAAGDARAAQNAAWLPEGLLVWGDGGAAMFDAETGKAEWTHDAAELAGPRLAGAAGSGAAVVAAGWTPAAPAAVPAEAGGPRGGRAVQAQAQRAALIEIQRAQADAVIRLQPQQVPNLPPQQRLAVQQAIFQANNRAAPPVGQRQSGRADAAGPVAADGGPVVAAVVVPRAGTLAVVVAGPDQAAAAVGIDAARGEVAWTAPLPAGRVGATSAGGDYLGVETLDDGQTLSVFDFDTGRLVTRRAFADDANAALAAFLVSDQNELLFATPTAVTATDLDADPQGARFTLPAAAVGDNPLAFAVAGGGPGRLRVVGDKLLLYADPAAAGRQDVLVVSLADGRPVPVPVAAADANADAGQVAQVPLLLVGGEGDDETDAANRPGLPPNVRPRFNNNNAAQPAAGATAAMVTSGTSVYLMAERGLAAYDLTLAGRQWSRLNSLGMRLNDPSTNLTAVVGRHDLLLFDRPRDPSGNGGAARLRLIAFSRDRLGRGVESGAQRAEIELVGPPADGPGARRNGRRPAAVDTLDVGGRPVQWQATDGGVALRTDAGRLVFLRGNGGAAQ